MNGKREAKSSRNRHDHENSPGYYKRQKQEGHFSRKLIVVSHLSEVRREQEEAIGISHKQ